MNSCAPDCREGQRAPSWRRTLGKALAILLALGPYLAGQAQAWLLEMTAWYLTSGNPQTMYSSFEILQSGSHYSGYWMGTVTSKADLTSALRLIITDCKSGPWGGFMCPFVVEQESQSWDDSEVWLLVCPQCFLLGRDKTKRDLLVKLSCFSHSVSLDPARTCRRKQS